MWTAGIRLHSKRDAPDQENLLAVGTSRSCPTGGNISNGHKIIPCPGVIRPLPNATPY